MDCQQIMDVFLETGVIRKGHFQLASGRHSDMLLSSANLFEHPEYTEKLAKELASYFADEEIDYVVGPALGGVILSYEVARQLGGKSIYCERVNGKMMFKRGFAVAPGQRVLIVEDVVTTGASLNEVYDLLNGMLATVIGVGVIIDRSGGRVDLPVPFKSLMDIDSVAYTSDECPMCKENIPLEKIDFLRRASAWIPDNRILI